MSPQQQGGAPPWVQPGQYLSPFVGPMGGPPGSYFIPPVALPPQGGGSPMAPVGNGGMPADWTGFPTGGVVVGSPYAHPSHVSPQSSHPQTPYTAPGTAYNAFQQPLPQGYPPGAMPHMWPQMMQSQMMQPQMMQMFTPYAMPGAVPGGWPTTPYVQTGLPPQGMPQQPPQQAPPPAAAPPPRIVRPHDAIEVDKVDRFAEGPHYGPVLDPMLVKKVKARVEVNPLLMPPPDAEDRDYIKWNMLFSTAQCVRSSDPPHRSWSNGRSAPATWPRVTSLRLMSRSIPWPIEVPASDPLLGVTCGDVIEAVHAYMNGRVSQRQFDLAPESQKRILSEAFYHNRSTAHGVPGGRLPQTLLRFDWLGQDTMFGGIVANEGFVKELCRGALPCIFELKCLRRYPMSEREIQEQEAREAEAEAGTRTRRRTRSRVTSRATSRATSRPPSSRATTVESGSSEE